jgi:hypothetical protein
LTPVSATLTPEVAIAPPGTDTWKLVIGCVVEYGVPPVVQHASLNMLYATVMGLVAVGGTV